jgi:F0F1-type ATP synthase membrane subunit b/b'
MFAFINFLLFLAAEAESHGGASFYDKYLNYPGFEAWKFLNLFIFVAALVYLLRRPISDAFKARREAIRAELIKAQQERDAALARLQQVEERLQNLDAETARIREQSVREAEAEATRIAEQTAADIEKIRENARREIIAASANARRELKQFSAEESIRLAEDMVRQNLQSGTDAARLVNASIEGLGGVKQ